MSVAYRTGERIIDDEGITFPVTDPPPLVTVAHDMEFDGLIELYLEAVGA